MRNGKTRGAWLESLVGKLRRAWFSTFRRGYVRARLRLRRGACLQCGACCRLAFRCPFLDPNNLCRIYHRGRPGNCTLFPLDSRDLADVGGRCGYYFVGESEGVVPLESHEPPPLP